MKHTLLALIAAAGITGTATAQDAQPEHGAAWFNQQTLALAERAAAGWNAMPGGLLWRRVKGDGTGPAPTLDDTVTVHYAGTLADGTRFDSSYDRGEPATFPLRGLVPAWQMAIPYMGIGDTIEIAAPATLAYGPRGRGPIPGGATLLFTVELLGIEGVAAD
ncbi:FKBP-type 22 kDa peptidyl-prolyl cis-trans isomerase [Croceibacterium atlanticum]|uniref:Peptidyl-prolyl cis-trans isomerase n=2 Tax=Croceibacterium atlanticum TaxID=1267766 RepID=A0A0F7KWM7_9SPHN|nr:FKBP-type peptidyl-prolyl cis-trans isomerase [Croceibacterium atlanticum]AKH43205.1 FKBP-type 22 kDa peptidyl-prolyl cis-trans isomerase [Croceibacterium atlanticum]